MIKAAQIQLIKETGKSVTFLLDDFLTDLDESTIKKCLIMIFEMDVQTFLTQPLKHSIFIQELINNKPDLKTQNIFL